jgi:peptidyl-prolyl cis-trans isomerase D
MLDLMRKHSRSWLIKVLLGTIIVVFVFFYGWGYMERKAGLIASINGTNISIKSYEEYYRNLLENFRNRGNKNPSEEILKDLRQVAFDNMVQRILIIQEAEQLNLSVTLDEIKDHVRRLPEFQRNGQFDRGLYLRILKLSRISANEFEVEQKNQIIITKLQNLIMDNVKVSDQEVLDHYRWSNEKVVLSFLKIDPSSFLNEVTPTDKDLEDYFNDHKSQFMIPKKTKVEVLLFDPVKYRNQIQIEEKDIKEIYELNVDQYRVPQRVSLRHILIKTLPTDDATTRTNALKKAEEALEKAKKGDDFSKLAKIYSDDENTVESGGFLGSVEKGQLLKPIDEVAFSMKKGEISRIIKSEYGFHILKVDDIQSPRTKTLKEVEPGLREELLLEQSKALASREAEEAFISLIEGNSMEKVAQQFKVPHKRTSFFADGEDVAEIETDETFYKAAFEVKPNDIQEVIESSGRFYIIKGIETAAPRLPKLTEVTKEVRDAFLSEKAKATALNKANEFIERLQKGESLARLAEELGKEVKETGSFSRLYRGYIPSIGYSDEIFQTAFSLSQENPLPEVPYWIDNRWVIVSLKERIGINNDSYEKERKNFFARLLQLKRNEVLQAWIEALTKRAKIEKYKAYNLI